MNSLGDKIWLLIAEMPPAYFALVMSTGIIPLAGYLLGLGFLALPLFWLNLGLFLALWLLTLLRRIFYPRRVLSDLKSHSRAVGFFTLIAGTCILGSQLAILMDAGNWAAALLFLGIGLWFFFIYAVFTALIVQTDKPSLREGLNGNWLVATVSTQSISILTCLVVSQFPAHREEFFFFALCMFHVGVILYLLLLSLFSIAFCLFPWNPRSLTLPSG